MNHSEVSALFDRLFPICRSITGPGIRRSLEIFAEHMPMQIHGVPSGSKVFDWTVPQEWELVGAEIKSLDGRTLVSTDTSNLHVLNFSAPFDGVVKREELFAHLFTHPTLPDAIPYVTSYYNERWGMCVSQQQKDQLTDDAYHISIDTKKYDGELNYGEAVLPGETDETILITSYLCHPSMANNELSGPLTALLLYKLLAERKSNRFTYRFVLLPETIGSISYLAENKESLGKNLFGGIVLTCLGGPKEGVSFKLSRQDWTGSPSVMDIVARNFALTNGENYRLRTFTPTGGSDERQFCSPGINWPVVQIARTVYGEYEQYHTSLDTKEFMGIDRLIDAAQKVRHYVEVLESADLRPECTLEGGEPQLGRRNLYPTLNSPVTRSMSSDRSQDGRYVLNKLLELYSLSDGTLNLAEIANKIEAPLGDLIPIMRELERGEVIGFAK
ncbi:MAG: DUF4910 domain-containing protein [Hoeflea sp.]|uniref:DUF4910 domain-containing protein n=1 Tax=Hoeflea sp. TaxID=1940281 RepID=UPI0032EAAFCE